MTWTNFRLHLLYHCWLWSS